MILTKVTPEMMMKGDPMQEGKLKRIWKETLAPKYLHEVMGVYHGIWIPNSSPMAFAVFPLS